MYVYIIATMLSMVFAGLIVKRKTSLAVTTKEIKYKNKSNWNYGSKQLYVFIAMFPLFIISAVRYYVGTDYDTYTRIFELISRGNVDVVEKIYSVEKSWIIFNRVLAYCTNDSLWIFVITSFVFCYFIFVAIFDNSINIVLSIVVFMTATFYFLALNAIRQFIVLAIFLFAIKYIINIHFSKYLITILIASTIHTSGLILIPVYFLCSKRVKVKTQLIGAVLLFIASYFIKPVVDYLILRTKYAGFVGSTLDAGNFLLLQTIVNGLILFAGYFYYIKDKRSVKYNLLLNIQYVGFALCLLSSLIPVACRIIYCFEISQILLIPEIVERENKYRVLIISGFVLLYIFKAIIFIYVLGNKDMIPYNTIFSIM